ncbi:MAG TPA: hypothetical protein VLA61_22295 [Ideonella sp.]|uniref:hypothetical protein n=1 Tax=Ideonella sp. TaxID=1929293 RepID=UPI002C9CF399|nr:hypothetical protein [Ideonella sp.]HSI51005.1 hypothetical protein [Ideonella sp.]
MSTVHTRYVTWLSRGRRGHGSAALDLVSPLSTQVDNPGVYQAWASSNISWEDSNGQEQNAQFAFWSVTGAAGGPGVSFSPSLNIEVEGSDVQATAWYLPGGGRGNGEKGTFVDAFDVAQGTFVDDDFVTISPDAELTNAANETGFVPSAAIETVSAYDTIHAVPFLDWRVMVQAPAGSDNVSTTHLHTGAGSTGVAFAFYQSTGGGGGIKVHPGRYQQGTWVSWGVMVDGGGPTGNGPVGPWDPLVRSLATALAMAEAAKLSDPELQRAGLDLAAKQLEMTAAKMAEAMRKGFSNPVRVTGMAAPNKR